MINCIIYEDNEKMQNLYESIVKNFYNNKNQEVIFYKFNKYDKNLEKKLSNIKENKIYILDIEVPEKSGLDLARSIRNSGDWNSPLIIITSYDHLKNTSFTSKMLMLDFISKKENIKEHLTETLELINNIVEENNSYVFQYNGKINNIDFKNILYFEKNLNDNCTSLYTNNEIYIVKENLMQINKNIKNVKNFLKINRSCIVNLHNIDYFDINNEIIYFKNSLYNISIKENSELLIANLEQNQIKNNIKSSKTYNS